MFRYLVSLAIVSIGLSSSQGHYPSYPPPPPPPSYPAPQSTVYLCQKCCHGVWQTEKVCNSRAEAMKWFNNQPDNARIIAQK